MTCIDLFCGLGGWAEGFLAEDFDVIGFDIERHDYGTGGYPGQLVLQDVITLHGSQFRNADVIVAIPPCQNYSYMAMPWKRAKAMAAEIRASAEKIEQLNALFNACFRIQREAIDATGAVCKECDGVGVIERRVAYSDKVDEQCQTCAGLGSVGMRYIPLVVENVKGAQQWVGRARWHFGSYYLWGDVPALMPTTRSIKNGQKVPVYSDPRRNGGKGAHLTNPAENLKRLDGVKQGGEWWHDPGSMTRRFSSRSAARKAASAQIAKIPFELASHIARVFRNGAEARP